MLKVDFERYYFWNISNETTKVIILVLWEEKMIVYKKLYNEYAYNYISNFKDNLLFLSENSTVWWHDMIISLRFDSFVCSLYNSMIQFLMWESQLAIYLFVIKSIYSWSSPLLTCMHLRILYVSGVCNQYAWGSECESICSHIMTIREPQGNFIFFNWCVLYAFNCGVGTFLLLNR